MDSLEDSFSSMTLGLVFMGLIGLMLYMWAEEPMGHEMLRREAHERNVAWCATNPLEFAPGECMRAVEAHEQACVPLSLWVETKTRYHSVTHVVDDYMRQCLVMGPVAYEAMRDEETRQVYESTGAGKKSMREYLPDYTYQRSNRITTPR